MSGTDADSLESTPSPNNEAPPNEPNKKADTERRLRQVKYRTEYQDHRHYDVLVADFKEESTQVINEEDLVLEIVDVRLISEVSKEKEKRYPPPKDLSKGHPYIVIHSPAVLEALRCVVDYFPAHDLSGNILKVPAPYAILVFFEKELSQYQQRLLDEPPDDSCLNRKAYEHITVIQDFVKEQSQKSVDAERERHARGYATFDMLWLLYKPGDDVYLDLNVGFHDPWVIKEVKFYLKNGSLDFYKLQAWNMCGDSKRVGPAQGYLVETERFAGEKKITELNAYPCKYLCMVDGMDEEQAEEVRRCFIERGKKWFALRRKVGCCFFDGLSNQYRRRQSRHITSMVMVDPIQYAMRNNWKKQSGHSGDVEENVVLMTDIENSCSPRKICSCDRCQRVIYQHAVKPRFMGYMNIKPLVADHLTEHQYFLCDNLVEAFVFKTREWELLDINGFQPPNFNRSIFESLVLSSHTKAMIKNLTTTYIHNSRDHAFKQSEEVKYRKIETIHKQEKPEMADASWSVDFIQGKGEGLTFLLHGKPGVGKTYTAECIAEHVGRPLLTLTCADLGSDPLSIEKNLEKWFLLGDRWDAIMLIDEADIYMEERKAQDIERNHLVSGFLRALEYFRGILFLTTNRVGTFDEAFISRIHVQIYYPDFSDDDREKVWQTFFRKLAHEREKTLRVVQDTKDYVTGREVKGLGWNGREIRNAFQIAVALAQAEDDKDEEGRVLIKSEHIQATVNMSREFKDYLNKLHKHDQGKLAALKGHRYDSFGSPSMEKVDRF